MEQSSNTNHNDHLLYPRWSRTEWTFTALHWFSNATSILTTDWWLGVIVAPFVAWTKLLYLEPS